MMIKQMTIGQISKQSIVLGAQMLKYGANYLEVSSAIIDYFSKHGIHLTRFIDGVDLLQYCMDLSYEVHLGKRDYQLNKIRKEVA